MAVQRADIYWVDFGTPQGSEQGGKRPALVIQNNIGNESSTTTIIAAITSRIKKLYPFHVDISAAESGLSRDGTILLEQIRTISQDRLIKRCGQLSSIKMKEVNQALRHSLEI